MQPVAVFCIPVRLSYPCPPGFLHEQIGIGRRLYHRVPCGRCVRDQQGTHAVFCAACGSCIICASPSGLPWRAIPTNRTLCLGLSQSQTTGDPAPVNGAAIPTRVSALLTPRHRRNTSRTCLPRIRIIGALHSSKTRHAPADPIPTSAAPSLLPCFGSIGMRFEVLFILAKVMHLVSTHKSGHFELRKGRKISQMKREPSFVAPRCFKQSFIPQKIKRDETRMVSKIGKDRIGRWTIPGPLHCTHFL